jgi:hypothetical protein
MIINSNFYSVFTNSSANAKKWEIELATLKSNNIRLTSALQVSNAIQFGGWEIKVTDGGFKLSKMFNLVLFALL